MHKTEPVIYIDPFGKEHVALVFAAKRKSTYRDRNGVEHTLFTPVDQGTDDCLVSGIYIDATAPESDNLKRFYDVVHFTDPSKEETNPALPTYEVNAWKELGEEHSALPSDHPAFDHPFHREFERDEKGNFKLDANGNKILKQPPRPEYDAHVAEHRAKPETQAAMAAASAPTNTYGPESQEYIDAYNFLGLRGYEREAIDAVLASSLPERIKEMSDAQQAYEAALASEPVTPYANVVSSEEHKQALDRLAQAEAAVDQGSDALFAKDAEIRKLQQTNTILNEQIAQLKTPPSTSTEGSATGSATEPDVATQLENDKPAAESSTEQAS